MILCGNVIVVAKHRSTGTCTSHFSGADFSSSNKCVSLTVSPCIGPWATGRVSCRPCELCCYDARCRYGGTAASDDEWDWWLGPRATADWMGDEKNRGDQITRMEWERIAIDRKKQHGIPLELAWLWGAKIGVCASVYSSCYWGAFDGSKWVIELGQRLLRNFLSSQQSDVLGSSSQSRRCRWHRTTHAADELQQEEHDAHSQHVFFLVLSVIKWVQRCWTYLSMACISAQHHVRHCVIYAYAKR